MHPKGLFKGVAKRAIKANADHAAGQGCTHAKHSSKNVTSCLIWWAVPIQVNALLVVMVWWFSLLRVKASSAEASYHLSFTCRLLSEKLSTADHFSEVSERVATYLSKP